MDRNAEIRRFYEQGYTMEKLANFFDISETRIRQVINSDNKCLHELKNKNLSVRETQIIQMVAKGKTDTEVADELGISARTVQTHVTRIGLKLQASNRTNAVYEACYRGII